jgi:DNA-directed RNA polymerase specialized sigma24 family protein
VRLSLEDLHLVAETRGLDLLALDQALTHLARVAPLAGSVVELHCFCGLSLVEIAEALGKSESTVRRKWTFAQTFLAETLLVAP